VAENQHITYNEFLPRVLGRHFTAVFSLDPLTKGYYDGYDPECDAGILNEFSTAAYRFGHSLIRNTFSLNGPGRHGRSLSEINLHNHFHNPDLMKNSDNMDEMLRGLLLTPMQEVDANLAKELTEHLFEDLSDPLSGSDLAARNIQRGRDHGIPSYVHYRHICKLNPVQTFDDLRDYMDDVVVERLKSVYEDVADIDLFSGGLAERRISGAMTGPTFACIIGLQFSHLRKCDRFWYENDLPNVRFSEDQLREIRGTTISAMVCRNLENPHNEEVPRSGFDQVNSRSNPMLNCMSGGIKQINLEPWRENNQPTSQNNQFQRNTQNIRDQVQPNAYNSRDQTCQVNGLSFPLHSTQRVSPCSSCRCNREGPKCRAVDVSYCRNLVKEFGAAAVRNDFNCQQSCIVKRVNGAFIGVNVKK